MEIEEKLAKYRAKKAREEKMTEIKTKAKEVFNSLWKTNKTPNPGPVEETVDEPLMPPEAYSSPTNLDSVSESDEDPINCCTLMDFLYYVLFFVLWVILLAIFIEFEFGTVFLILSALIFICFNTRTGPKNIGEPSAYSVFNRNCESIDGTLKAEQFEREIRYGGL